MKRSILLSAVLLTASIFTASVFAQTAARPADSFDAEAAKRLGADEYGMKQYVFVILRTGKAKRPAGKEMDVLQNGHLKNIMRLGDEAKLALAGPFMDDQEMRGIFIFNAKTIEEAKKLLENDPLVSGGYLEAEFHPWYGSAALMDVTQTHKKIQKKKIAE